MDGYFSNSGFSAFHFAELRRDSEALAHAAATAKQGSWYEGVVLAIRIENAQKERANAAEEDRERAQRHVDYLIEQRRLRLRKLYEEE